ncbi:MAG: elongation factor P [Rickettsiales bacterium]|jgi:elongation factor P|nr:elongation factor P [Rickettsiales bacterium]
MSKENANLIRPGWVILHNGKQYGVIGIQIIQPGKGGAFIQVEMRDVETGLKTEQRWRTADTVEKLLAEDKDYSFLYFEGGGIVFMEDETYEQITIPADLLGDRAKLLQDGMKVVISFVEGRPIGVKLPKNAVVRIAETEPVVKGQTATSSFKPAVTDNGIRIMVPQFLDTGTDIIISTDDLSYIERAKK